MRSDTRVQEDALKSEASRTQTSLFPLLGKRNFKGPYSCSASSDLIQIQICQRSYRQQVRHFRARDKNSLNLKAPITTAADDILKYFFIVFQRK